MAPLSPAVTRWGLVAALLGLWELGGRTLVTDPRTALFLPLPSTIALAAAALARDGTLLAAIVRSAGRVARPMISSS